MAANAAGIEAGARRIEEFMWELEKQSRFSILYVLYDLLDLFFSTQGTERHSIQFIVKCF